VPSLSGLTNWYVAVLTRNASVDCHRIGGSEACVKTYLYPLAVFTISIKCQSTQPLLLLLLFSQHGGKVPTNRATKQPKLFLDWAGDLGDFEFLILIIRWVQVFVRHRQKAPLN